MSLRFAAVAVSLALATAPAAAGQNPTPVAAPTGIIRGVVTAAETGRPVHGTQVFVEGGTIPQLEPRRAITDEQGRYEIRALAPGRYSVSASKAMYARTWFAQQPAADRARPVDVSASALQDRIDFVLRRGGTIVARVTDEFGDALAGVPVRPYEAVFLDGQRRLRPFFGAVQNVTDDRGEVRLFGLPPGEYYVAATTMSLGGTPPVGRAQTLYPGTVTETDARPIRVSLGEEVPVTFAMVRSRPARVSGVVVGSGGPLANATIRFQRNELGGFSSQEVSAQADGTFSVGDVLPGDYVITVRSPENARMDVRVFGEDVADLVITTKKTPQVRGRIIFDPPESRGGLQPAAISIRPLAGLASTQGLGVGRLALASDWTFDLTGVVGVGVLRLMPNAQSRGWFLKAVLLDDRDVTETPLDFSDYDGKRVDVVLTRTRSEVSGTLVDSRGAPTGGEIIVFPENDARWTPQSHGIAVARPDQNGRFEIGGLPAGRYLIAATSSLEPGQERNPETLARLRADATALSLGEGESRTVNMRLGR